MNPEEREMRARQLCREFWERVFLGRVEYYRASGWGDSSSAAAAMDADRATDEWRKRFAV